MKICGWQAIFVTLLFLFSSLSYGQDSIKLRRAYYLDLSVGSGTHLEYAASLYYSNKKRYTFSGFISIAERKASNVPNDYTPGLYLFGFFPPDPGIFLTTYGLAIGKIITPSKWVRINPSAGIVYGTVERPVNFVPHIQHGGGFGGNWFDFSSNYDYSIDKKWFIGLYGHVRCMFLLTRFAGLSIGARTNINPQDITLTFNAGLLLGYLR